MIVSPGFTTSSVCCTLCSVTAPEGTISQTWRGGSGCSPSSSNVSAVESTFGSYVFTSWPWTSRRRVIPEPIRPSPTIPSCTSHHLLESHPRDAAAALLQGGQVAGGLRADQPPQTVGLA